VAYSRVNFTVANLALMPRQPYIVLVLGITNRGIKQPGREAHRSLPSSVEVKSYTPSHPSTYSLRGV
jgi:hypothetical protein